MTAFKFGLAFGAFLFVACKITCENLPVHEEVVVIPVRVEATPVPNQCRSENEYIETLLTRLNFNCGEGGW